MSKEAMKLALEALENSIDLVSQEARNAEELYGKYPTRLARIQGLVAFEVAHEKAIAALKSLAEKQTQQEPVGCEWTPCMKLPVVVHVRKQRLGEAHVSTREGITPVHPDDLIMRGVSGEEYPIGRAIFEQTYTLDTTPQAQPAPMFQPNRVISYAAAKKLRELGYEWMNDEWKHLDELADQPVPVPWSQALEAVWAEEDDPIGDLQGRLIAEQALAHCEAGPEYCQQCHKEAFEDRSLALAAAVRYVKNNTPNLVWAEINRALATPQAQRKSLTLQELEAAWNAQADHMNTWNELGLDEIVAWAQAAHNIKEKNQ